MWNSHLDCWFNAIVFAVLILHLVGSNKHNAHKEHECANLPPQVRRKESPFPHLVSLVGKIFCRQKFGIQKFDIPAVQKFGDSGQVGAQIDA